MRVKIDPTKNATENLIRLLNDANPDYVFSTESVTDGAISDYAGGDLNTEVVITAIKNMGFSGSTVIAYRRLTLDESVLPITKPVRVAMGDTLLTLPDRLAGVLGLVRSDIDFTQVTLPTAPIPFSLVKIVPKTTSKLYLGTDVLEVELVDIDIVIDNQTEDVNGVELGIISFITSVKEEIDAADLLLR